MGSRTNSGRNVRRVALGLLLVTGVAALPLAATGALSSAPAAAASTTHTAKLEGNTGDAYEPEAQGKFYCNSLTDSWALSLTGVQVIASDEITPWQTGNTEYGNNPIPGDYYVFVQVDPSGGSIFLVSLKQDPSTGLYEANKSDNVGSAFGCAKGTAVRVWGEAGNDPYPLFLQATLK